MQVIKDGNNILVSGIVNGAKVPLADLGLPEDQSKIKLVWWVDEKLLLSKPDGSPIALKDAKPVHHQNAFVEDRMHDWWINKGLFRYAAHSSEVGDTVSILIQLK